MMCGLNVECRIIGGGLGWCLWRRYRQSFLEDGMDCFSVIFMGVGSFVNFIMMFGMC